MKFDLLVNIILENTVGNIKYAFTTGQGSRYIMTDKGATRRIKSFHANTGGQDQGLHDWQDLAIFTDPKMETKANAGQFLMGNGFRIALKVQNNNGEFYVLDQKNNTWRIATVADAYPKYAKINQNEANQPLKFKCVSYPAKDWNILEMKFRTDKTIRSIHFGSPVSEIKTQLSKTELEEFLK